MQKELQQIYLKMISPGVFLLFILFGLYFFEYDTVYFSIGRIGSFSILLASVLFSFIIPMWFRISFIQKMKHKKETPSELFLKFQKMYLQISSPSFYLMILGYIAGIEQKIMVIIILSALYALYFYYPSEKKIEREKKIFKVK